MALKLITPATALAVSLIDAKTHLRVDSSDDDTLITSLIKAATEVAEQFTGRAIMPQTWQLTLDSFPDALQLTRVPVASVSSLQYTDSVGTLQTLDSSAYSLDNLDDEGFAYVLPAYGTTWPAPRAQANAVKCTFIAGWADAAAVPDGIKTFIKLTMAAAYENPASEGAAQTHKTALAERLLDRHKVWAL